MYQKAIKSYVKDRFLSADIQLDGGRPWDIKVNDERFFSKVFFQRSLGLGEAYMEGMIDAPQLDASIHRLMESQLGNTYDPAWRQIFNVISPLIINKQSKKRALEVGKYHYDLSDRLFQCMLDKRMTYSCAYWKDATNLDEAQEAKLDLICRKLGLKPGMKVLDIGCGWGSFSKYAAEKYGVKVIGITIAEKQLELAREMCRGYPIELRFQDYRDLSPREKFDHIVSVGQMEHVGYKNYRIYMETVARVLKDDGLFLLHTIGNNYSTYYGDPWIVKYIFPNGMVPSAQQLARASEKLFVMEDWHNFGIYYDKTLMAWFNNFCKHWPELKSHYDERFFRMWSYYLMTCAGAFRARQLQLWQIVYSKNGVQGGYQSVR